MDITAPRFINADNAREYLEAQRWPQGPYCPHCGSFAAKRLEGKAHRAGLIQCNDCREQYTVTVGTVFERSKVPLNKWLLCNHLLCASKKGMSAHEIHRLLGVTYKTAWFMCHRIREAMDGAASNGPLGGANTVVGIDSATGLAIFSGVRTDQAISFIRRCYEARGLQMHPELMSALTALSQISSFRNDIVHQQVSFDEGIPIVSNAESVINPNVIRTRRIEMDTILNYSVELGVIIVIIEAFMIDEVDRAAEELGLTPDSAWHKKYPLPKKQDPRRQPKTRRASKRPHQS